MLLDVIEAARILPRHEYEGVPPALGARRRSEDPPT